MKIGPLMRIVLAGSTSLATGAVWAADVTPQRLVNAASETENWLTYYQTYDGHRFSKLAQINRDNVKNLKFAFSVALGGTNPGSAGSPEQQSTPLVDDGFMYVNNAWNQVYKIDVRSGTHGDILWKFDPATDTGYPASSIASRGIAMLGNNAYVSTIDMHMASVDRDSGETIWQKAIAAPAEESSPTQKITAAPVAINDMILVGESSAGSRGDRGWLGAFKASDGSLAWRTFAIPKPGEPGSETWKDDHNAWRTGGGSVWSTPTYDPDTSVIYWGTGDAAPFYDPQFRPGDNLFSASTIASDLNTGKMKWYFQEVPNESWDMDSVNARILYDVNVNGQPTKVVSNFGRDGFFYTFQRVSGQFIRGVPYQEVINWTAGLDPKTGKPVEYDPTKDLQTYAGNVSRRGQDAKLSCPNTIGSPTFMPPTFDQSTLTAYVSSSVGCFKVTLKGPYDAATNWVGKNWADGGGGSPAQGRQMGQIVSIDASTGQFKNRTVTPYPIYSGLLGTAGHLIFTGHLDGKVSAYDSDTLAEVWSVNVGMPIQAPPIAYGVDGREYIAIVAGGGGALVGGFNAPELSKLQSGSTLYVFGL